MRHLKTEAAIYVEPHLRQVIHICKLCAAPFKMECKSDPTRRYVVPSLRRASTKGRAPQQRSDVTTCGVGFALYLKWVPHNFHICVTECSIHLEWGSTYVATSVLRCCTPFETSQMGVHICVVVLRPDPGQAGFPAGWTDSPSIRLQCFDEF